MLQSSTPLYLDANASLPAPGEHLAKVLTRLQEVDGNPSSIHAPGRRARVAVEEARLAVAKALGGDREGIVFTSGGTEANNTILAHFLRSRRVSSQDRPVRVLASPADHSSVRSLLVASQDLGRCTLMDLGAPSAIRHSLAPDLAVLTYVNSEVGTVTDVLAVARIIKEFAPAAHVHVDAVQALGKLDLTPLGAVKSNIDSIAISGHKIGSLKGIGALYLRPGSSTWDHLDPLLCGGGQERRRRAGTENLAGIISLGIRMEDLTELACDWEAVRTVTNQIREVLTREVRGIEFHRAPPQLSIEDAPCGDVGNTLNFHVMGLRGEDILMALDLSGIYASSGSACASGLSLPSPTLLWYGYGKEVASSSVRLSLPPSLARCRGDEIGARIAHILRDLHALRAARN